MSDDYYSILEIQKDASEDDIKKSYKTELRILFIKKFILKDVAQKGTKLKGSCLYSKQMLGR